VPNRVSAESFPRALFPLDTFSLPSETELFAETVLGVVLNWEA